MEEIGKEIKGYEGHYGVSNTGKVKSKTRELCQVYSHGRYMRVQLCRNYKKISYSVHRLVAEAFIPNPNHYETVNHIDRNRKNNKVSNLEGMSQGDNIRDAVAKKVYQYDLEGNLLKVYDSMNMTAKETGMSITTLYKLSNGLTSKKYPDYLGKIK